MERTKWEQLVALASDLDLADMATGNQDQEKIIIYAKLEAMERRLEDMADILVTVAQHNEALLSQLKEIALEEEDLEDVEEQGDELHQDIKRADIVPKTPRDDSITYT